MSRFNNGIIQTNENCISCNRCIYECSVPGANVSIAASNSKVYVDGRKCLSCGKCIGNCVNKARYYTDDTDLFFQALDQNEKISLIVEPSFFSHYKKQAYHILGYLKFLGVQKIYSSSFGSEISLWAHVKYIKENSKLPDYKKAFIANTCPVFVNFINRYKSELRHKIIKVHSPLMCTAIYVNKYLNDNNKLVYLGPCIGSKIEIMSPDTMGRVSLNVTFNKLMKKIEDVDTSDYYAEPDLQSSGFGNYVSVAGGMKACISYFFPRNEELVSYSGINDNTIEMLSYSLNHDYPGTQPLFAEVISCTNGCAVGPGIDFQNFNMAKIISDYQIVHRDSFDNNFFSEDYQSNYKKLCNQFEQLNSDDFSRNYERLYRQPIIIPQNTYEEIFTSMLKDTPQKRKINCQLCGYKTCAEMAAAIACGYNKKENCIHYMNDEIRRMYFYDTLTGLPNSTCFIKDVEKLFGEAKNENNGEDQKYIICIGDINRFKLIDDLYGNDTGDKVLVKIAQTLKNAFDSSTLIARLSGGQFAICFKYNLENMNILHSIKSYDCSDLGIIFPVTMRFGIYSVVNKTESVQAMINYATISMDTNVSIYKNTYTIFNSQLRDKMKMEIAITSQMPQALENNEFQLYFQPQYNASSGKMIGAESLCRWIKPGGAIISPELFIPIAEKNGFIKNLDVAIWEMAFKRLRKWIDDGINVVPVSVNISRVSLASDSFAGIIERLVKKYNVPKNYIHFEITESAYMSDKENIIRRIDKLRNMGFMIAMDDFGSGYSTLNSLKDISIDILKLDMGFLKHSNMDKGGKIISNVIHMAQALQFITIAEGVETKEQADFLKSLGCDIIQGFLYAKPMPEQNFVALLSNQQIELLPEKTSQEKILNVGSLYDLSSAENIMFQNFTGPALIVEFCDANNSLNLLRINEKAEKLFGVQEKGFSEIRDYFNNVDIGDAEKILTETAKECVVRKRETSAYFEARNFNTNRFLWLKVSFSEISCMGDKHTIFGLLENYTEEKLSDTALSITGSLLKSLVGHETVAMIEAFVEADFTNPLQSSNISVMKVNQEFLNMFGYDKDYILSWNKTDIFSAVDPESLQTFSSNCIEAIRNSDSGTRSFRSRFKNAAEQFMDVSIIISAKRIRDNAYILLANFVLD